MRSLKKGISCGGEEEKKKKRTRQKVVSNGPKKGSGGCPWKLSFAKVDLIDLDDTCPNQVVIALVEAQLVQLGEQRLWVPRPWSFRMVSCCSCKPT